MHFFHALVSGSPVWSVRGVGFRFDCLCENAAYAAAWLTAYAVLIGTLVMVAAAVLRRRR